MQAGLWANHREPMPKKGKLHSMREDRSVRKRKVEKRIS
jgi:hypothetical protein